MPEIFNPIKSVEFIYTQKCNLKCAHCINNCSSEKEGKLDLNRVLLMVNLLPELGVKSIGITGGESLLFPEEIIKIISTAKKLKIKSTLISNGFWGSTKEKAEKMAKKLGSAGLCNLNISTDQFHSEFIPLKSVFNVFDALHQEGIKPVLRIASTKEYSALDFVAQNKDYFKEIKSKQHFSIQSQPLLPFGRAFDNIPKSKYVVIPIKNKIKKKCSFLYRLTINHDGRSFICCNGLEAQGTPFELENFYLYPPEKLVESFQKNLLIFYLRTKGPYFIEKLARKNKLKKTSKIKKLLDDYVAVCDYCVLQLSQYSREDVYEMLEKEFKKDRELIRIAEKEERARKKGKIARKNQKKAN